MSGRELRVVDDAAALRAALDAAAPEDGGPVLVPTMGALHAGHLALIDRATGIGRPVVVSIFVNPTQFAPGDDFERYPRPREADLAACRERDVDVVFAPTRDVVYPNDLDLRTPPLPAVATEPGLEDASRPGHFAGVVQIVARLFDLVRPAGAVFGEKDYQQLLVIRAMADRAASSEPERWGDLEIVGVPTVREPSGLALSSRNRFLDDEQQAAARGLSRALQAAAAASRVSTAEHLMRDTLDAHGLEIDYAVVRDATTLMPVEGFGRPTRALIAARCGSTRLIDNRALPVWS